jgi:ABC-type uncharacterized transport system ATPase subunit
MERDPRVRVATPDGVQEPRVRAFSGDSLLQRASRSAFHKEAFLELKDRGRAIVFSTHQMDQVEELCDAIAIIDRGRMVVSGATGEVRRQAGRRVVRIAVAGDPDLACVADSNRASQSWPRAAASARVSP